MTSATVSSHSTLSLDPPSPSKSPRSNIPQLDSRSACEPSTSSTTSLSSPSTKSNSFGVTSFSTTSSTLPTMLKSTVPTDHDRRLHSPQLPTLPRFHPAAFQLRLSDSANPIQQTSRPPRSPLSSQPPAFSSMQPVPAVSLQPSYQLQASQTPHLPATSPVSRHRQQTEAQRQLHLYQREILAAAGKTASKSPREKPASPKLIPLGSPGPVTPLALEEQGGYLVAGMKAGSGGVGQDGARDVAMDQLGRSENAVAGKEGAPGWTARGFMEAAQGEKI